MKKRDKLTIILAFIVLSASLSLFAWSSLVGYLETKGKDKVPVVAVDGMQFATQAALMEYIKPLPETSAIQGVQTSPPIIEPSVPPPDETACKNQQGLDMSQVRSQSGSPKCIVPKDRTPRPDSSVIVTSESIYANVQDIVQTILPDLRPALR